MAEQSGQDFDADLAALFSKDEAPAGRRCKSCGGEASPDPRVCFCGYCGTALDPPPPKNVLIVDDSSLSRKTIAAVLLQLGCKVLEAADAPQGLELARAEQLHLIILDVVMPGMSGLDFLKRLRQHPPSAKTPVIMLTSKADLSTVSQALSQGAADYLLKHSAPDEIKQRLQKHLGL